MDGLITPYAWDFYETSNLPVSHKGARKSWGALCQRLGLATAGAIALTLVGSQLQAARYPSAGTAYIDPPPGYNLNIRSGPGTRYPAVNTLSRGTPIAITGYYENGWAQLTDRSWVAGNLISGSGTGPYGPTAIAQGVARTAYINSPSGYNVNIRSGPGTRYPAVNTLPPGTPITITGYYENGWAQLTDRSWVASNLISLGPPVAVPGPTPQPPVQPPPNVEYFQVGTRDPEVIRLELRLRELGYVTGNFVADNYYGTDTAQAVRNFQQVNGLPIDGVAGPRTRQVLYSSNAIPNGPGANRPRPPFTDPGPTDPGPTDPGPTDPGPTDPGPTDPGPTDPGPTDPSTSIEAVVTSADDTDAILFSGPGTEYELLGFLPVGTTVTATGRIQDGWYELEDGGWIYEDFLDFAAQ